MTPVTDHKFRRLAAAAALMTYALIIVGGLVRTSGSGLGCPDWPLCHGQALPPADVAAWIEFSHRAVAAVTGVLLVVTAVVALRRYRHLRPVSAPVTFAALLLVLQVPLGAIVVLTELEPLIVAFHLSMAMLIFAGVLVTAIAAGRPAQVPGERSQVPGLLVAAALSVFAVLMTGAWVVGGRAQLACPDWPLCYDALLPGPDASPQIAIQLLHRYAVAAVSILVIALVVKMLSARRIARPLLVWTVYLGASFAMQVMVGAFQVLFLLPVGWRVLHLAFASAAWASLVALLAYHWLAGGVEAVRTAHNARDRGRAGVPAGD